jgi:hypothetical protein
MKQVILLSVVSLLTLQCLKAQVADSAHYKNSIAIDATSLVNSVLSFSGSGPWSQSPYIIEYRRMIGKKNVVKAGMNVFVYSSGDTRNDTLPNGRSDLRFTIGAGYERLVPINKRWTFYFGTDMAYAYLNFQGKYSWSSASYMTDHQEENVYSIAPIAGMIFHLNKRLSISTESRLQFNYSQISSERIYVPDTQYSYSTKGTHYYTDFVPPSSIYFRFAF